MKKIVISLMIVLGVIELRAAEQRHLLATFGGDKAIFTLYYDDVTLKATRLCAVISTSTVFPGCGFVQRGGGQGAPKPKFFINDGVENCLAISQQGAGSIQLTWNEAKQRIDGFTGDYSYPFKKMSGGPCEELGNNPLVPCGQCPE